VGKRKPLNWLLAVTLSALALPAWSATLFEFRDSDGEKSKLWVEGKQARLDGSGEPGTYAVFDLSGGRIYGVNPARKEIVLFTPEMLKSDTPKSAAPKFKVKLDDRGAGPNIAGYATRHYVVIGDDEECGQYFLSKDALKDGGDLVQAQNMLNKAWDSEFDDEDPCDQAESELQRRIPSLGLPLRELDADGELVTEVTRIQKNAPLPQGGLDLPKGYKQVSLEDYVKRSIEQQQQKK